MGFNLSRKRKHLFAAAGAFLALLLLRILLVVGRDSIVIQYGIHLYQLFCNGITVALIATVLLIILSAVRLILSLIQVKKASELAPEPAAPEPKAVLSVSKELDSAKLYEILTAYAAKSKVASKELLQCAMQLRTMDLYQEKLANLLQNNGAETLSDTKDVLDKVEQYLCKAIRKVINYIDVSDENSAKDAQMILQKLNACYQDCQKQLDQAKEFLFVMAEFLNKQGGDDTSPEMLNVYRTCILKSIHEEDSSQRKEPQLKL